MGHPCVPRNSRPMLLHTQTLLQNLTPKNPVSSLNSRSHPSHHPACPHISIPAGINSRIPVLSQGDPQGVSTLEGGPSQLVPPSPTGKSTSRMWDEEGRDPGGPSNRPAVRAWGPSGSQSVGIWTAGPRLDLVVRSPVGCPLVPAPDLSSGWGPWPGHSHE